ncbi:MAG: hypothetical protein SGILL_004413 [Bacillariaceae sp.]
MAWTGSCSKAASTANAVSNAPTSSPGIEFTSSMHQRVTAPMPHHGQRPSLAGFDPFSTNEEQYSVSPVKRYSQNSVAASESPHLSVSNDRKTLQNLSLRTIKTAASPRLSALQNAATEKRSQSSRDHSPDANIENDQRQPPTPTSKSPSSRKSPKMVEVISPTSPHPSPKKKEKPHSAAKLLSFVRKGHRISKSLGGNNKEENKVLKIPTAPTQDSGPTLGELDTPGSSNSKSIVQDLMDLKDKFVQLQIPTLAKPSPTSFLTGKGDEAVRTSEYEPSPFQMELPSLPEVVEVARLNDFVENYRRMDQNFDLEQFVGYSSLDLQEVKIKEHIPIAQSLIECGDGLTVQGFLSEGKSSDDRLEAVVFEGQRYFTVVFRGTTEQQTKILGSSKTKRKAVPLEADQEDVEVYIGFKEEYTKLEQKCFKLIDKLSEQNPFCDVVFSGYSFGAAMATLAASRYAMARPMMRVGCFTLASPKVGFSMYRHVVNSLPNLKVVRLELGQDAKCQGPTVGGWHVGHTIVRSGSIGNPAAQKTQKAVLAYKFDTPKHKKFKTTHPDLRHYITVLEEIAQSNLPWASDFVNNSGNGVVVNNEARQVV